MATVNIIVDDKLIEQAENVFDEIGLNLTTATTIFLKQVVRWNGMPFELRVDPFYSVENQSHLMAAKERMERTGGTVHDLIEVEDD